MSGIYINVHGYGGSHGEKICHDLVDLARRLDITIQCDFNDVTVMAKPADDPAALWRSLQYQLSQNGPYRFATADGRNVGGEP